MDLEGIDANASNGAADDAFRYIGFNPFTGAAGELRSQLQDYKSTLILGDMDGDGVADLQILLSGAHQLLDRDFVL